MRPGGEARPLTTAPTPPTTPTPTVSSPADEADRRFVLESTDGTTECMEDLRCMVDIGCMGGIPTPMGVGVTSAFDARDASLAIEVQQSKHRGQVEEERGDCDVGWLESGGIVGGRERGAAAAGGEQQCA